jgi:hypothetical protein
MNYSVINISLLDGDEDGFFWVDVFIQDEVEDELGTFKSCDVKVSLKKADLKLSEIRELGNMRISPSHEIISF